MLKQLIAKKDALDAKIQKRVDIYNQEREAIRSEARYCRSLKNAVRSSNKRAEEYGARGTLTVEDWLAKKRAYGFKCADCGAHEASLFFDGKGFLTVGHAVPLSRGGSNYISNIVPQCHQCNVEQARKIRGEIRA